MQINKIIGYIVNIGYDFVLHVDADGLVPVRHQAISNNMNDSIPNYKAYNLHCLYKISKEWWYLKS